MNSANACIGCGAATVKNLITLGPQPPSNRYLSGMDEETDTHPIEFGYCDRCVLAQLLNPMPPAMVRSRFDWISYNEPEGHLDELVETLWAMTRTSPSTQIVGVTYKDDSTLARFKRKGSEAVYRLQPDLDLGIGNALSGLETIQEALTVSLASEIGERIGRADLVLVRHILEHTHQPHRFIEACRQLAKPGGLLVFEVPDCRKILDGHDHFFLWEEHISYFTPATFRGFFRSSGFDDMDVRVYRYPMEDSLIVIVRNSCSKAPDTPVNANGEKERLVSFAAAFSARASRIRNHLQMLHSQGKSIALFGAGHLAAKFINFYELAPYFCGVIDDNPNKIGLFMPGSNLPIIGSNCLEDGKVDLCLLTLNPESERRVRKAKAGYLSRGGRFLSIFSASEHNIDQDIKDD